MTRKEAMARFMAAKEKKHQCVVRLEEKMKVAYEQRTGKPANYTFAFGFTVNSRFYRTSYTSFITV